MARRLHSIMRILKQSTSATTSERRSERPQLTEVIGRDGRVARPSLMRKLWFSVISAGVEIKTKKQQVCRSGESLVAEIDAKPGG
jgi:hypothetical protein